MNGKGDKQRPLSVDKKTFDNNWDRIFNKNLEVPGGMWKHNCKYNGLLFNTKEQPCN